MTSIKLLCRRSVAIPRSHRGGKFRAHHKIRERGSLYMSRRRSSSTFAAPVKSSRREPSKSGLWPELNGPGAILIRNKSLLTTEPKQGEPVTGFHVVSVHSMVLFSAMPAPDNSQTVLWLSVIAASRTVFRLRSFGRIARSHQGVQPLGSSSGIRSARLLQRSYSPTANQRF